MNHDILSIGGEPIFDDRIVKFETHTYNPYANTTFGYSDEIRIPIQHQDLYTLPCQSFLHVEGKFTTRRKDGAPPPTAVKVEPRLTNFFIAFMFDEIRYELDGVEIDRNRNVGITSSIKNYLSLSADEERTLVRAGWNIEKTAPSTFDLCVPLKLLLGFCEDYKSIIINARHELILIRARNDLNCLKVDPVYDYQLRLTRLQWKMPHVVLNDVNKLSLLRTLEGGRYLSMGFRSWDLYEYPLLQSTTKHTWAVKASTQLEKPRYVVFALQTARRNKLEEDASKFDACDLINCKLFLNSEFYPYDDMNVDFAKGKFNILYDMFVNFRKTYYANDVREVALSPVEFIVHGPFTVIDCSRQNESVKSATVDIRIEFECRENVPENTTAYCLIIHDRLVEYNPLTNVIRKII